MDTANLTQAYKEAGFDCTIPDNILSIQMNLLNACPSRCLSCRKYEWPNVQLDIDADGRITQTREDVEKIVSDLEKAYKLQAFENLYVESLQSYYESTNKYAQQVGENNTAIGELKDAVESFGMLKDQDERWGIFGYWDKLVEGYYDAVNAGDFNKIKDTVGELKSLAYTPYSIANGTTMVYLQMASDAEKAIELAETAYNSTMNYADAVNTASDNLYWVQDQLTTITDGEFAPTIDMESLDNAVDTSTG